MPSPEVALLQGTLDVIVLKTLSWGPMHGFGIAKRIQTVSDNALRVEEGSLYPALYRMEERGWVKAEWRITENNRRAKYYRLTKTGQQQLARQSTSWADFAKALTKILAAGQPA